MQYLLGFRKECKVYYNYICSVFLAVPAMLPEATLCCTANAVLLGKFLMAIKGAIKAFEWLLRSNLSTRQFFVFVLTCLHWFLLFSCGLLSKMFVSTGPK